MGALGWLLGLFCIPLIFVLWRQQAQPKKRVEELKREMTELHIEIERLKAALKKSRAREEDLSKKLILIVKRHQARKKTGS